MGQENPIFEQSQIRSPMRVFEVEREKATARELRLTYFPAPHPTGSEVDTFTSWSPWTPCSKTCSDPDLPAIKTRMRFCQGGANCTGDSFQEQECNLPQCMGESLLISWGTGGGVLYAHAESLPKAVSAPLMSMRGESCRQKVVCISFPLPHYPQPFNKQPLYLQGSTPSVIRCVCLRIPRSAPSP